MKTDHSGFYTTMNAADRPTTAECRWTTSLLAQCVCFKVVFSFKVQKLCTNQLLLVFTLIFIHFKFNNTLKEQTWQFSSSCQLCNLILLFSSQSHVIWNPCFLQNIQKTSLFLEINERMLNIWCSDEETEQKQCCFTKNTTFFLLPPLLLTIKQFKINTTILMADKHFNEKYWR